MELLGVGLLKPVYGLLLARARGGKAAQCAPGAPGLKAQKAAKFTAPALWHAWIELPLMLLVSMFL